MTTFLEALTITLRYHRSPGKLANWITFLGKVLPQDQSVHILSYYRGHADPTGIVTEIHLIIVLHNVSCVI